MKAIFNISVILSMVLSTFLAGMPKVSANYTPEPPIEGIAQDLSASLKVKAKHPATEIPGMEPSEAANASEPYPDWAPQLELSTDLEFIEAGKNVDVSWEVIGELPEDIKKDELSLEFSYPSSFTLQKDDEVAPSTQDESTYIREFEQMGKLEWIPVSDVLNTFSMSLFLVFQETIIADASITIETGFSGDISQSGGELVEPNGKIKIKFPEKSVDESLKIKVKHITDSHGQLSYVLSNNTFEITANSIETQQEIHQFNQPRQIIIQYNPEQIQGNESDLSLKYYDFEYKAWMPLPSEVDPDNHLLIGYTDHFSFFDFNVDDWQAGTLPNLKDFQTSGFTGAATYTYPIQVPPGPGGFQPSLGVTYNSNVVDSATNRTQASWVGMGWDLTTGFVVRNMNGTATRRVYIGYNKYEYRQYTEDDSFTLSLNGQSWQLLPIGSVGTHITEYRTTDETFLRIYNYYDNGDNYWLVWDKNGNVYKLGDEAGVPGHIAKDGYCGYAWEYLGDNVWNQIPVYESIIWKWGLNEVRNKFYSTSLNNVIKYNYNFDVFSVSCEGHMWDKQLAMYPKEIIYPNGKYRIEFTLTSREDYRTEWVTTLHEKNRLNDIIIEHDPDSNDITPNELIRKYHFSYDDTIIFPNNKWRDVPGRTPALVSITEYGNDGLSALPATTFTYADKMHLTQASNGYGGLINYTYDNGGSPWRDIVGNDELKANYDRISKQINTKYIVGDYREQYPLGQYVRILFRVKLQYTSVEVKVGFSNGDINPDNFHEAENTTRIQDLGSMVYLYEGYVRIPADIDRVRFYYECLNGACTIQSYDVWNIVTRAQVTQKVESASLGTTPITISYTYDGTAINDTAHSVVAGTAKPYVKKNSEFRGNSSVRQLAADNTFKTTWFYQQDKLVGRTPMTIDGKYMFGDSFNAQDTSKWDYNSNKIQVYERIEGDTAFKMVNPVTDWQNILHRKDHSIISGSDTNAMLVDFMIKPSTSDFVIRLDNQWTKYWGLAFGGGRIYSFYKNASGDFTGPDLIPTDEFLYDTWYTGMFIAEGGNYHIWIWQRDNPDISGSITFNVPDYAGLPWAMVSYVNQGTAYLDSYMEGRIYSYNSTSYQICNMTNGDGGAECPSAITTYVFPRYVSSGIFYPYDIVTPSWVALIQETKMIYNGDADFEATSTSYNYAKDMQGGTQYGNVTRTYQAEYNGSLFVNRLNTLSQFYPNVSSSLYLTGLPGYLNQYQCPAGVCDEATANLLSSDINIYDSNPNFWYAPTVGIVTHKRKLLHIELDPLVIHYADELNNYDAWGNLISVTNYSGEGPGISTFATEGARTTTSTYDTNYHTYLVSQTDAMGHNPTTFTYNYRMSVPESMVDPNGAVTEARYDSFGRLVKIWRPGDSENSPTNTVSYNIGTDLFWTEATQKVDSVQTYTVRKFYNGMGQLIQTQQVGLTLDDEGCTGVTCASMVDSYYDPSGRLEYQSMPYAIATPAGYVDRAESQPRVNTQYDWLGRVTKVIQPDESEVETVYEDLTTKTFDALGHMTIRTSDVWGNLVEVIPATGPGVTYGYDLLGRLTSATYGSNATTIQYDLAGRKTFMDDPDMGDWTYFYDALGNLTYQQDAKGHVTCLYYDSLNRLKGKNYLSSGTCPSDPGYENYTVSYVYDNYYYVNGVLTEGDPSIQGIGHRTGMRDPSGSTAWVYDSRGRITDETKTIDSMPYHTGYTYNSADLPVSMTYPGGQVVNFDYLPQMTVDSISSSPTIPFVRRSNYDASGRIVNRCLIDSAVYRDDACSISNSFIQYYDYNPWTTDIQGGRLAHTTYGTVANNTQFNDLSYLYLPNGSISTISPQPIEDPNDPQTAELDGAKRYTYDAINRLTQDCVLGSNSECDINTINGYGYNANTGNLVTKDANTLTYNSSSHPHAAITFSNGNSFIYDANGNQITRMVDGVTYTLTYDSENRLTDITGGTLTASNIYDGDGNRVKTDVNGTISIYIGNYYEVIDPPGDNNTEINKYYYAGGTRVAISDNGEVRYFVTDHLSSTIKLINSDGSEFSDMEYMSWGADRLSPPDIGTSFKYTGQREAEAGLYFYNARWYDPELGRFIQADTDVPESQGSTLGFDRYAYVGNNPVNLIDPSGHCWGFASGLREWGAYTTTCSNMDNALTIVQHPEANFGQQALAGSYIAAEVIAHAGVVAGIALGSIGVAETLLGLGTTACADGNCTNEIGATYHAAESVWNLTPFARGRAIESIFDRSPDLAQNFPVIDRWQAGTATSIKSIDLLANSYQNLATLTRTVQGYIDTLAFWQGARWGTVTINPADIITRNLELAIPPNAQQFQMDILNKLIIYASDQGVNLIIRTIR